jgi:indole-3-glycerol phosphate synthase
MILDDIVRDNLAELALKKARLPLDEMQQLALSQPPPRDFAAALSGDTTGLIAEIKQASPSQGLIRDDFDPAAIARVYAGGGAAAISVLTEPRYFKGNLSYLREIRESLGEDCPPLLRKDFITDPYQVYEARAFRADALLLIAAILPAGELDILLRLTRQLGMSALVEAHNEKELELAVNSGARLIGINNRDLTSFEVDINTTFRLRKLIPQDRIVVSESGINRREDIINLQQAGIDAVLIGESLMAADDIQAKMKELLP